MNNRAASCTPYEQEVYLIMTRIGVEQSLSDVEELLKQKGMMSYVFKMNSKWISVTVMSSQD